MHMVVPSRHEGDFVSSTFSSDWGLRLPSARGVASTGGDEKGEGGLRMVFCGVMSSSWGTSGGSPKLRFNAPHAFGSEGPVINVPLIGAGP